MELLEIDLSSLSNQRYTSPLQQISIVNAADISYKEFFAEYLFQNRPCLLKNISQDWACQKEWVKDGKPNFDWLSRRYGRAEVPVSNCKERYFNAQSKRTMILEKFLDYWQDYIGKEHPVESDCFYMKDWHFSNENPLENVYRVPSFFSSDWINEYLLKDPNLDDDYRFVYMGPKGSWTPLHVDVFSSYSWSVNICGTKKWVFFPPGEEEMLKDKFGKLVYDVESEDLIDSSKFPHYSPTDNRIVLIQEVGDAIFVPSGWHHQVWNLDDTISFNHNWINGCNINKMWDSLSECFKSVTQEISDCILMDGWDAQCQLLLKSCFGMNHMDFYTFVTMIAHSRLDCLIKGEMLKVNGGWYLGPNHCYFDLNRINSLLTSMLNTDVSCYKDHIDEMKLLVSKIDEVIHCTIT
uniref:2-oxoglutarate and iron-dependent oxygenase JMJD4 n=1 Tax=Lygus hesperus TaxID=30085 RepID=A0A0A9VXW8_LYGHE